MEASISTEHEKRQKAAFSRYLRFGPGQLQPEDKRLIQEFRDMSESGLATGVVASGNDGASLVPVGFERSVVSAMKDFSPLLHVANVVSTDNARRIPIQRTTMPRSKASSCRRELRRLSPISISRAKLS